MDIIQHPQWGITLVLTFPSAPYWRGGDGGGDARCFWCQRGGGAPCGGGRAEDCS